MNDKLQKIYGIKIFSLLTLFALGICGCGKSEHRKQKSVEKTSVVKMKHMEKREGKNILLKNALKECNIKKFKKLWQEKYGNEFSESENHPEMIEMLRQSLDSQCKEIFKFILSRIDIDKYQHKLEPIFELCIKKGKISFVKIFLKQGFDFDVTSWGSIENVFLYAAKKNLFDLAKFLLSEGADVNATDKNGKSALFFAVENNNPEFTKYLISHKARLDIKDAEGNTPLMTAVGKKLPQITEILIKYDTDVTTKNTHGVSVLEKVISLGDIEIADKIIREINNRKNISRKNDIINQIALLTVNKEAVPILNLLIEKKIPLEDIKDEKGDTLLIMAIKHNKSEVYNMFIRKKLLINTPNDTGDTPLIIAVKKQNKDIIEKLLKAGADINIVNSYGETPLSAAISVNNIEILKLFFKYGIKFDTDMAGQALLSAIRASSLKIAEFLINKGANLNYKDPITGETPLLSAIRENIPVLVNLLIRKGADITTKDKNGISPLFVAEKANNLKLLKVILKAIRSLSKQKKIFDIKDEYGYSPLSFAILRGKKNILKLLLDFGANPNISMPDGETILMYAIKNNFDDMAKILITHKADLEVKDSYGYTPLLYCIANKKTNLTKFLIQHKANVNTGSSFTGPPLLLAVRKNQLDTVKLLLKHGADVNVKDIYGNTALSLAKRFNYIDIERVLIRFGAKSEF